MRVKTSPVKPEPLKKAWTDVALKNAERLAVQVEQDMIDLLTPTIQSPAFADAEIVTGHAIEHAGGTLRIHVHTTVKGSLIWEFQQWGTRSRIQTKTTPPIPERDQPKVLKRRLRLGQQGRTGRTFVIPAGKRVRGVEAAEWYQAAGAQERRAIQEKTARYKVVAISTKEHYGE